MTYVCPMHEEVEKKKAGVCPKCGMALVKKSKASKINHSINKFRDSYKPLFIIIFLILITSFAITLRSEFFSLKTFLESFMIGFFLTFAGFKLIDIDGFAEGYSTYDLLAKHWYGYGILYPFIELFFGLSMILLPNIDLILQMEIVVMAFSGLGVLIKMQKKEHFQCACLGTFLKVPLTKVTLIEDFGMAFLGIILLAM